MKKEEIGEYVLFSNDDGTENILSFEDANGKINFIKLNPYVREEFRMMKSEINSYNIKFCRYAEHINLSENELNNRAIHKQKSVEDEVIDNQSVLEIINEIWKLPYPQNKRVYMYIVKGLSNKEISKIENRCHSVISRSIEAGLNTLRKKLQKKYKNF
ncbi:MAG: hypothetical protein IJJ82_04065 [Clostridia bacterium]|nr:hypothetical protein [Clostridia bacterium]MBR0491206.1 hypothetical protein [Clostridia bacterium]